MKKNKVSVILPCYNQVHYVRDSIDSVLNQSHEDLELILIDNVSTDGTKEILEEYEKKDMRINCIYHKKNTGFTSSINDGLSIAKGKFIAIQNSDDVWYPNKLEEQLNVFNRNPKVDVVASDADIIDEKGKRRSYSFFDNLGWKKFGLINNSFREICISDFCCHPSLIFRSSCLESMDSYDKNLSFASDWWFLINLAKLGHTFYIIKSKLLGYRVHSFNISNDNSVVHKDMMLIRKRLADMDVNKSQNLAKAAFYASFLNDYSTARTFASDALARADLNLLERTGLGFIMRSNYSGPVLLKLNQLKHFSSALIHKLGFR